MQPKEAPITGPDNVHQSVAPEKSARAEAAASVRGISKKFGETVVLDDIDFDVGEGESIVLLGASGSGKTTILRIIAGLEEPDTGRVVLHGKDVFGRPVIPLGPDMAAITGGD